MADAQHIAVDAIVIESVGARVAGHGPREAVASALAVPLTSRCSCSRPASFSGRGASRHHARSRRTRS
jgi:hypothetical protein